MSFTLNSLLQNALWQQQFRRVVIATAGFLMLAEEAEAAKKFPSRVGIYKARKKAQRCSANRHVSFEQITGRLTSAEFRAAFRMGREQFFELLEILSPDLTKSIEMGKRGGNDTVLPAARLAITLRILAGARYGDLMMLFCISKSTVYSVFHDTVGALAKKLQLALLPQSEEGLKILAEGMKNSRSKGNPLTGCIGALDGICVRIEKPISDLYLALFYCRKGYYAIPVQALVDHSYRFLCASANCAGSTHDSLAHSSSKLGMYLQKGLLGKLDSR